MIPQDRYSITVHLPGGGSLLLLPHVVAEAFSKGQPLGGEIEPWQIQEMAEALIYHLRVDLKRDAIGFDELVSALKELAVACGFQTTTIAVETIVSADLYVLAQDTGYGFELAFFQSIERAIRDFRAGHARLIRFVGLRACVKMLVGARNWCKKCQRLSDEIVEFIRSHMQLWPQQEAVVFAVS